jgi:cytoskeletal protein CcmA (bactofilin family)
MFGRKSEEKPIKSLNIDSLIGEDIIISGKIRGSGNIRIDGTIEGDIDYIGEITLGETGKVKGNIVCENLIAAGNINGNLVSKNGLTLLPTGILAGDIEVKSLVIHENAKFNGNCKMIVSPDNVKALNVNKKVNEKKEEEKSDIRS